MSFTENSSPVKLSVTENSCPSDPCTSKIVDPDPCTVKVLPSHVRLASALIVLELTEVITLLSAAFVYEVIPAFTPWIP